MNKSLLILVFFCLKALVSVSQNNLAVQYTSPKNASDNFYLHYNVSGLGSNIGSFLPVIKIENGVLLYTYEQNSYWREKDSRIDTICLVHIRETSVDSILQLVQNIKDTTISRINACVMSGVVHFMTISNGIDTTSFRLHNTFDYTALKVVDILNTYLPREKKLEANAQMIKDDDCRAWRKERQNKKDKKENGTEESSE